MNAEQIRAIFREELNTALAAFFAVPVPVARTQEIDDQIQHALRLPALMAETERQRPIIAARRARKAERGR